MTAIPEVRRDIASSVGQDNNRDAPNSRYTVFSPSDVPTSLSELFERAKSENEERSQKRGYQDWTGQANDSDIPTQKRQKLDSDPPLAITAIPVDTDIFDLLPKEFPGLPIELLEKIEGMRSKVKSVQEELMGVIAELCSITSFSVLELSAVVNRKESTITTYTGRMVKQGQLFPDNPYLPISHKNQKFVVPVLEQNDSDSDDIDTSTQQCTKLDPLPSVLPPVTSSAPTIPVKTDILDFLPTGFPDLSEELEQKIQKIRSPHKSLPEEITDVIEELCSIIPFSALELAIILKRKTSTVITTYIGAMMRERQLFHTKLSLSKYSEEQKFAAANLANQG